MRFAVALLTSPPATLRGYVERYLYAMAPGVYVGGAISSTLVDLKDAMESHAAAGALLASSQLHESGFEVMYYRVAGRRLIALDGVDLVEIEKTVSPILPIESIK